MKKIKTITRNTLLILLTLLITYFAIHNVLCAYEAKKYVSPYSFTTVNGEKISYRIQGSGENIIVLLPALGTSAPILDFEPLSNELSKSNTVITIEPFGYGWSDKTKSPRTLENEAAELHEVLQSIGISKPVILMPHSISGLTALYYSNIYHDEVAGIIGIDCTLPKMPAYFNEEIPAQNPAFVGKLCDLGVIRLLQLLEPSGFISDNSSGLYSENNLKMQSSLASKNASNTTVVNENNMIARNIEISKDFTFSKNLPILFFTTEGSDNGSDNTQKSNVSFFETYITNPDVQSVIAFDAPHYMHWTKAKEISDVTDTFINKHFE